jgi:hypothetical protein
VFRLRLGEPGLIASGQTGQLLSEFVRHETLGTPSEVPVPRNTIRDFDPDFCVPEIDIEEGYRLSDVFLAFIRAQSAHTLWLWLLRFRSSSTASKQGDGCCHRPIYRIPYRLREQSPGYVVADTTGTIPWQIDCDG